MVIDRAKEIAAELSDNDITEKIKGIQVENMRLDKGAKKKMYDEVDLEQISLFDTTTDQDVINELNSLELTTMTPLDAMNALYRLQNKIKYRWKG